MIEFGINYKVNDTLWVQAINAEFTFVLLHKLFT